MEREVIINKTLRDMKQFGIINEDLVPYARPFLERMSVATWEMRGKFQGNRRSKEIIQLNEQMEEIDRFPNILKASKTIKCTPRTIRNAIRTGGITSGKITGRRNYWRYAE